MRGSFAGGGILAYEDGNVTCIIDGAEVDDVAEERVAVEDHLGARRVRVVRYHHVVQSHGDCKFHGETQNIIPRAKEYGYTWLLFLLSR